MKSTYTFCVIKQADKPGQMELETLFTTSREDEVRELRKFLLEQDAGFRRYAQGRNARPVVVVHVDPKEHERWVETPGRNGLQSRSVRTGQAFRSAVEASGWIGLRHNEVAMLLSRTAATGEKQATVRGVTFAYKDDVSDNK
jgi:hypothetical protein